MSRFLSPCVPLKGLKVAQFMLSDGDILNKTAGEERKQKRATHSGDV